MAVLAVCMINGCCITKPNCDPEGGNFKFGPELSYRISNFYGEDAKDNDDIKSMGSIGFGGYVHWVFCEDYPKMGIYSGLFYNQFGAKFVYGDDEVSKNRLSYLSIPITYTYEFYEGIRAEIGPDISFLVAAKDKYEYLGEKESYDIKEDVRNVQIGYNIALSYTHYESGFGGFFRYNGAFTKMPSSDYDYNVVNGGFSFGIRYQMNHLFHK
jgi:hypothetical protein